MGSWSMTCAFTGLPVDAGDEVRLIGLLPEGLGLNAGAMGDFSPITGAIKGAYDDYGFVEGAEPTPLGLFLAGACEGAPSFEQWMERIHEGTLGVPHRDSRAERLKGARPAFTLVHEKAWQAMLSLPQELSLHYSIDQRHSGLEILAMAEDEIAQWARGLPDARSVFAKSLGSEFDDEAGAEATPQDAQIKAQRDRLMEMMWKNEKFDGIPENGAARCLFGETFWNSYHSVLGGKLCEALWSAVAERPEEFSEEQLRSITRELGEVALVTHNLFALRKRWEPAPSGPQCGQVAAHWLWHRAMGELVEARFEALRQSELEDGGYDELFPIANALYEKDQMSASAPIPEPPTAKRGPGL